MVSVIEFIQVRNICAIRWDCCQWFSRSAGFTEFAFPPRSSYNSFHAQFSILSPSFTRYLINVHYFDLLGCLLADALTLVGCCSPLFFSIILAFSLGTAPLLSAQQVRSLNWVDRSHLLDRSLMLELCFTAPWDTVVQSFFPLTLETSMEGYSVRIEPWHITCHSMYHLVNYVSACLPKHFFCSSSRWHVLSHLTAPDIGRKCVGCGSAY